MKKLSLVILFLSFSINTYSQELLTDFDKINLVVLNDELNRIRNNYSNTLEIAEEGKIKASSTDTRDYLNTKVDNSTIEVVSNKLQVKDSGITSAKILDDSIVAADIKTTAAIPYSKLSFSNNIVAGDLAADSVGSDEIAANAVGASEIASSGVSAGSYTLASITVDEDGRLTSASSGSSTGIKSVQRGNVTKTGTGGSYFDTTITAVTLSKTFCLAWGAENSTGVTLITVAPTLTSTTNLRIYWSSNADSTYRITWEVVEFN